MIKTPRPNPADESADTSSRPPNDDGRGPAPLSANRRAFFRQILGLGIERAENATRRFDQLLEHYADSDAPDAASDTEPPAEPDPADQADDPDTAASADDADFPLKLNRPPNTEPRT